MDKHKRKFDFVEVPTLDATVLKKTRFIFNVECIMATKSICNKKTAVVTYGANFSNQVRFRPSYIDP